MIEQRLFRVGDKVKFNIRKKALAEYTVDEEKKERVLRWWEDRFPRLHLKTIADIQAVRLKVINIRRCNSQSSPHPHCLQQGCTGFLSLRDIKTGVEIIDQCFSFDEMKIRHASNINCLPTVGRPSTGLKDKSITWQNRKQPALQE